MRRIASGCKNVRKAIDDMAKNVGKFGLDTCKSVMNVLY